MRLYGKYTIAIVMFIFLSIGCSDTSRTVPGYIEGEYTYISSGMTGTLFQLMVKRGQTVKKGEVLFQLDPQPETASVLATEANIRDLASQVVFAQSQWARQKDLYTTQNTSKADLDQAQTDLNTRSQLLVAEKAQLIQMKWALQQKTQYAPVRGTVFDTFYRVGEKVEAAHPVLAILAPENIKVLFYLPEGMLSTIRLGQTVTFSCDGCHGTTDAIVSYISPEAEYTPPVIYSKDTRYKLVYLIRASLSASIAEKFHPGQPIEVHWSSR